jgi:hypothetical protein
LPVVAASKFFGLVTQNLCTSLIKRKISVRGEDVEIKLTVAQVDDFPEVIFA